MALRLQVQGVVQGRRRAAGPPALGGRPAGLVAGLGLVADEPDEVGEERELLAHQRAVDAVLARDLAEQAAQLGGALARRAGALGGDQRAQALERDVRRGDAEQRRRRAAAARVRSCSSRPRRPISVWISASLASTRSTSRARIASPWASTSAQQLLGGADLVVEVGEQLRLEHRVHHGVTFCMAANSCGARPIPPASASASVMASLTASARRSVVQRRRALRHLLDELAEQDLLEAERGLVGLLVVLACPCGPPRAAPRRRPGGSAESGHSSLDPVGDLPHLVLRSGSPWT